MDLRPAPAPYCRDSYLSYGLMQVSVSFIMLVFIFFFFFFTFQMCVEVERKFLCNANTVKKLEEIGGMCLINLPCFQTRDL